MEIPTIVASNWGKLTGGLLGSGGLLVILFKDAIREFWEDRKMARLAEINSKASTIISPDKVVTELLAMHRLDSDRNFLLAQENGRRLDRAIVALEGLGSMLSDQKIELGWMHDKISKIEGAVLSNGHS